MPALEKTVVKKIKGYLESTGAVVIKNHGSQFSAGGVADLTGCLEGGRFFAIEVKAENKGLKNLTDLQARFLIDVYNAGGIACVANDLGLVKEAIRTQSIQAVSKGWVTK